MQKLILLVFILISFLQSCKDETIPPCTHPDEFYEISDEAKDKIPYNGRDTLKFLYRDSIGNRDTVTYFGQGKVYDTILLEWVKVNDYCSYTKTAETYSILYKTSNAEYNMRFYVDGSDKFLINFKNLNVDDNVGRINWPGYEGYHQELKLNDNIYYQVNEFYAPVKAYVDWSTAMKLFYTSKQGIIRMEILKTKETFDLIQ